MWNSLWSLLPTSLTGEVPQGKESDDNGMLQRNTAPSQPTTTTTTTTSLVSAVSSVTVSSGSAEAAQAISSMARERMPQNPLHLESVQLVDSNTVTILEDTLSGSITSKEVQSADVEEQSSGLWSGILSGVRNAIGNVSSAVNSYGQYVYEDTIKPVGAGIVLWGESNNTDIELSEDVRTLMDQIDPQKELPEECRLLAQAAAPYVAKALIGEECGQTVLDGLTVYLGKITYKILACLATASAAKNKNITTYVSAYEEFVALAKVEGHIEEDSWRPADCLYLAGAVAVKTSDVPSGKQDVFDLASSTLLDLAEKHLGSVFLLLEQIEVYVNSPENTEADQANKAAKKAELLKLLNPIIEEVLSICQLTNIKSLGLSQGLTKVIEIGVGYKAQTSGMSDWDYIICVLKESLFDYYCKILVDRKVATAKTEPVETKLVLPEGELNNIVQKFLQNTLARERSNAEMPLLLPEKILCKLRKVDCKKRLPGFCKRVSKAIATKVVEKNLDSFSSYCNARTLLCLRKFLSLYINKVMYKALAHLATSSATSSLLEQDLWLNVTTSLINIANKHYKLIKEFTSGDDFTSSLKEVVAQYDALPEEDDGEKSNKEAVYKKICKQCSPIIDDLLQTCGLKDIEDLQLSGAVNNLLKTVALAGKHEQAWDLVREMLQWGLLELIRIGPELESSMDDEHPDMVSIARSGAKDGGPAILQALVDISEPIGQALEQLLEYHGWNIVDARSLEKIFVALFKGESPVYSTFQQQFGDFLSPRVCGILTHAASFSCPRGPEEVDPIQTANALANIMTNAFEVIRRNVKGLGSRLQRVVKVYESQELLLHTLYAGKRHFEKLEQCKKVQNLILAKPRNDPHGKSKDKGPAIEEREEVEYPRYRVTGINDQIDIQCWKILEAAQCADRISDIAAAARMFLGEVDDLKEDLDVIKLALFGTYDAQRFDQMLKNCNENYAIVEASCNRILNEHFTGLAVDALAMTGIDNDQITQIPGLAAILDPKKGTAMQWLMLKAYNEFTAPQQTRGYNEQLEEVLFGAPRVSLDALKELVEAHADKQEFQDAWNERKKTAMVVNFFENTCAVFAQDIRNCVKKYFKENSNEIVSVIDSCLAEKFTSEAATLLSDGLQELAEERCTSVKCAFDYIEELFFGGLFKLLVKIGKVQVGKSGVASNEQMMSAILLQIFNIMDAHKVEIATSMEKWHQMPELSEVDKSERQTALRKIFRKTSDDVLKLIGDEPLSDMVPPFMEKAIEKALRKKLLPDLFGKMYCEATVLERQKRLNEDRLQSLFRIPENPQKGSKVPQQAMSAFAQYAAQAAPSYLALNSMATTETLLDGLTKHFAKAGPAGSRAAAYLNANRQVGCMFEKNIRALALNKEHLQSTWDSVDTFVESILLQALGNLSGKITLLEDGKSELLQSIMLQLLQLVALHVEQLDDVRKSHDKTYIYEVEPVELLRGQARRSQNPSDNPAFEKEYLEAKEGLDEAQKELQELKDSRLSLVKQFKSHLGGFLGARFRRSLKFKMEEIERDLAPAYAKRAEKQKIFDAVRKKRCFLPIAQDLLELMNFNSAEDLPFPSIVQAQLWDLLRNEILPEALQNVYDTLLDRNVLDSMLISALQALDTTATDASIGKADAIVRTPAQKDFDTALGKAVVVIIRNFPSMLSRSILNMDYINKMAVDAIGQRLRMVFSEQTLIKILHQGLFSGMEGLVPKGEWEIDPLGDGQPILKQAGSTKLNFGLPMTDKEKRRADRRREAEGVANAAKVHKLVGQATSKQIKAMIASKIKAGWETFQDSFDASIAKHCGGEDGWGMQIKRFFDMVFRTLFIEVIGTLLYYGIWPLYKVIELIFDAVCEAFGKRFQKSLHAGFNDALVFGVSKDFFAALRDLKTDRMPAVP